MNKCKICGFENNDGAEICNHCSAKLDNVKPIPDSFLDNYNGLLSALFLLACILLPYFTVKIFKSNPNGIYNADGYQYVDLGLSVKWAAFNIGSISPEGCGIFFVWGDTTVLYTTLDPLTFKKDNIDGYTLMAYQRTKNWRKYSNANGITLDLEDDPANLLWGGDWRTPTKDEFQELIDNCLWTWGEKNQIKGYFVKSKINNKSIFLPALGELVKDFRGGKNDGIYWSSTSDSVKSHYAYELYMGRTVKEIRSNEREDALQIRAVHLLTVNNSAAISVI